MAEAPRSRGTGPLAGLKIIEFAGIGPAPFCGMLLSDLGADVIRIDRLGHTGGSSPANVTARGRRSVALDLKSPAGVMACLALADVADGLLEGFRPGVMERLGLGPDVIMARNPRLAYGRMTGWGQTGPYAKMAGHDLNYIAISGALHAIGLPDKPVPPLNLVGDFGGGALYLAFGLVSAILHARETGRGQIIDCAMSDGSASLMAMFYGMFADGIWRDGRRANMLDGAAPWYDTYRCGDGQWIAIGAIEAHFYAQLVAKLGLDLASLPDRADEACWPALRELFKGAFVGRSRDEWCAVFAGSDACFGPVLALADAPHDPHNRMRGTFVEIAGVIQPAPNPRFSETPGAVQGPPPIVGEHGREVLADWGLPDAAIAALEQAGVLGRA